MQHRLIIARFKYLLLYSYYYILLIYIITIFVHSAFTFTGSNLINIDNNKYQKIIRSIGFLRPWAILGEIAVSYMRRLLSMKFKPKLERKMMQQTNVKYAPRVVSVQQEINLQHVLEDISLKKVSSKLLVGLTDQLNKYIFIK